MKVFKLKEVSKTTLEEINKRSFEKKDEISLRVKKVIEKIKNDGDKSIIQKYQQRHPTIRYGIKIEQTEIDRAYQKVSKSFIKATKQAIKNITLVHKTQLLPIREQTVETERGIKVWREWRAIEKVGLYIPGGKAIYPSSVLMTAIPALIAECKEIVMCTPPNDNGKIPAPTLVAADMVGLNKIYKVGGALAIAAMAFGTETIPKVYKIFGAGNAYVTEAKMQVFGEVDIDMPAGPSEVFIIADETADPSFIAADLLADGEHGEDSACVLLTTSEKLAYQVVKEIEVQLKKLSTAQRIRTALQNYGLIAIVDSLKEASDFCNVYAPEHLEIMIKNPEKILAKIINAGSVFIGEWTTKSAGDYATGANHVLPTGGMAKMFSPLSVDSFGKMMQVQQVMSKTALGRIKKTIETYGAIEQLPAHKNATNIRFAKKINYET